MDSLKRKEGDEAIPLLTDIPPGSEKKRRLSFFQILRVVGTAVCIALIVASCQSTEPADIGVGVILSLCVCVCRGNHGTVPAEGGQWLPQAVLPGLLDPLLLLCPLHRLEDLAVRHKAMISE